MFATTAGDVGATVGPTDAVRAFRTALRRLGIQPLPTAEQLAASPLGATTYACPSAVSLGAPVAVTTAVVAGEAERTTRHAGAPPTVRGPPAPLDGPPTPFAGSAAVPATAGSSGGGDACLAPTDTLTVVLPGLEPAAPTAADAPPAPAQTGCAARAPPAS